MQTEVRALSKLDERKFEDDAGIIISRLSHVPAIMANYLVFHFLQILETKLVIVP